MGHSQIKKGLLGSAKKFGPHLQAGVWGCGGEVLKGTWPIPCFTLEVTEAGEEGKKRKVWCAKTTQYQHT